MSWRHYKIKQIRMYGCSLTFFFSLTVKIFFAPFADKCIFQKQVSFQLNLPTVNITLVYVMKVRFSSKRTIKNGK